MTVSSLRYFLTVSPHPRSVWLVCTAVVVIGGWTVSLDPAGVDTPLASLLFVQMFGAATGFCGPASRGRYDPLFVSGRPWPRIVLAHWAASSLPGWLAWLLIGVAELAVEPGKPPFAFQPRAMAALLLVSAFTWSLTVRVSRFTGGVVWCGALFVAAALRESLVWIGEALAKTKSAHDAADFGKSVFVHAAVPFALLERTPPAFETALVAVLLLLAAAVLGLTVLYLARRDFPLVEES